MEDPAPRRLIPMFTQRPDTRKIIIAAACLVVLLAPGACAKQPTPGGAAATTSPSVTLPFQSPSKRELAAATGIVFPRSVRDYRSVAIGPTAIDVAFSMASADVAAFASDSSIELSAGQRLITHSSPVWDQNPVGSISSGQVRKGTITSMIEVVSGSGDRVTVRLAVTS